MAAGDPRYRVVCEGRPPGKYKSRFGGHWRAERVSDGRVMTTDASPVGCLRWVNVWGPMRANDR